MATSQLQDSDSQLPNPPPPFIYSTFRYSSSNFHSTLEAEEAPPKQSRSRSGQSLVRSGQNRVRSGQLQSQPCSGEGQPQPPVGQSQQSQPQPQVQLSGQSQQSQPRSTQSGRRLQQELKDAMPEELKGSMFFNSNLLKDLSHISLDEALVEDCLVELGRKGLRIANPSALPDPIDPTSPPPQLADVSDRLSYFEIPAAKIKKIKRVKEAGADGGDGGKVKDEEGLEVKGEGEEGSEVKGEAEEESEEKGEAEGGPEEEGGKLPEEVRKWQKGKPESHYYNVLKDLLNMLTGVLTSKADRISRETSLIDKIAIVYDTTMKDRVGGAPPLKPDLLIPISNSARDHRNRGPNDRPLLPWKEVEIPIEVKNDHKDMFKQTATYARAVFSSNIDRLFVIGLLVLTGEKGSIDIVCYSRSGVCLSFPSIPFITLEGMRQLIHAWGRVLAIKEWKDKTVLGDGLIVNGKWTYKWVGGAIDRMICLRGRGTWVHRIEFKKNHAEPQTGMKRKESEGDISLPAAKSSGFDEPAPKFLIVKDSWPLKNSPNDWTIWQGLDRYFGVPRVWGCERLGDTSTFLPQDSNAWNVLENATTTPPEVRDHVRIFHNFNGESLARASERLGINDIFEALRDCFLGIIALYRKKRLHRDISPGNIIMLETPEERKLPEEYEECLGKCFKTRKCRAVVIDADHGAELNGSFSHDEFLTGTYDFMSTRLSRGVPYNIPKIHTILDDLESLVWVLVFLLSPKTPPVHPEGNLFAELEEDRGKRHLVSSKRSFIEKIFRGRPPLEEIPHGYRPLIVDGLSPLFAVVQEASEILQGTVDLQNPSSAGIRDISEDIIKKYADAWFDPKVEEAFANAPTPNPNPNPIDSAPDPTAIMAQSHG